MTSRSVLLTRLGRASLRTRILVVTTLMGALTLTVALAAYALTLDRILYVSATAEASDRAQDVAAELADGQTAQEALAGAPTNGALVQLVDRAGTVIASSDPAVADQQVADLHPRPGQTLTTQVDGVQPDPKDPYAVAARGLARPTDGAVTVLVASPLQVETTLVKGATAALGCLAMLLLGGLLWLIGRVLASALGKVEQIRVSVAAVEAAGSVTRVPVPSGGDEIARLAETMNAMLDRIQRADASQRAFVSDASHELRSPLTTIRTVGETSPGGIDEEGRQVVLAETLRMQSLVEDLLTLARADDPDRRSAREDVDLDEVALVEVRRMRATSGLTVTAQVEPARVVGDARQLTQVLRNLMDNAARHAATGIRVRLARVDDLALLTVDNDGAPVPPGQREAVFDRFARLQDARDRDSGGSGLGLAIVRALVTGHGGTAFATEATDGWCRFQVELPLPGEDRAVCRPRSPQSAADVARSW
ncbi:sensor histidine kinase [Arsenicicoccus dermatophilus]|uniref:sensor histidine kinase n=1 Tax=Arsenicicoccus dermatophilus TaxID=1076331 RepID=UPI001F4C6C7D|nr:HAMP domain-containing sensor histidine kinase [Arsenicicoccus dermatophilus]MCH8611817.1 HAMP domain-containing histidine kinase [Arsenicicoccus dermatophilus]